MPEATAAIRRQAFQAVTRGEAVAPTALAERTGLAPAQVDEALALLLSVGAAQVDESGRVVAIGGLSLRPTRHRLVLSGVPLSTWCALDAVGIPAALEEDAHVTTSCPYCGRVAEIEITHGRPVGASDFVVWLPAGPCSNVIEEFCSQVNLFCDGSHLEAWRASAGRPPGRALRLAEVAELGREIWGGLQ